MKHCFLRPKALQESKGVVDTPKMGPSTFPNHFYLYLWRSPNSPGTLYLAQGFETAEALCRGLTEDGYIVKVVHMATDAEFELRDGKLHPTTPSSLSRGPVTRDPSSHGPSSQGTSPAFA